MTRPTVIPKETKQETEERRKLVEAFLAAGGVIYQAAYGESAYEKKYRKLPDLGHPLMLRKEEPLRREL